MAGDLRVVELDFDKIKDNLKTFLKGQDYFTDYDFEGSALSILMELLAYDTHYKAYLANMTINESFIDTAVKRASVVSHAKPLGFVPRSIRAAHAVVDITVYGVTSNYVMTLDKYTPFTSTIDGVPYTFVTTEVFTAVPSGVFNTYTFSNVKLFEGSPVSYSYTVSNGAEKQLFKIPALNADTSTLSVSVQKSATDVSSVHYTYAEEMSKVTGEDTVYFLEEGVDGYFYVYFGDGVIGKKLEAGNIVELTYLVTHGAEANTSNIYSQIFTLDGTIADYSAANTVIEVISPSSGGADKQDIESVRFLAPKLYTANGRAITAPDYSALLRQNFPVIDSIVVWGGEENNPPMFGKVLIAVKPKNSFVLDYTIREEIRKYLNTKSMINIEPVFVEPDFTFVTVNSSIKFDSKLTNKTANQISNLASGVIKSFFDANLQQFGKILYVSRLQAAVDSIDESILGNTISVSLQKRIEPVFSTSSSFTSYFNNTITPYSLYSSAFNIVSAGTAYTVVIKDSPDTSPPTSAKTGTLTLVDIVSDTVVNKNIGSVNYMTGVMTINNLVITGYPSIYLSDIRVNCSPRDHIDEISNTSSNLSIPLSSRNQILMLDDSMAVPTYSVNNGLTVTSTAL